MNAPQRVVLDTNTIISALVFSSGRLAHLRHIWQSGDIVPLVDEQIVDELNRVLTYPKFQLSQQQREAILGDYLPYAETVPGSGGLQKTLTIDDIDDLKFLALALRGNADIIISGDSDLYDLRDVWRDVPIVSPREFLSD